MNKSTQSLNFLKPILRLYYKFADVETGRATLSGTVRPLWRDTSIYQGKWNADIAYFNGVVGHIGRAGHGLVADPTFLTNYTNSGNVGMYHSSYYAIDPQYPPTTQLDIWYRQHPKLDIIPRVIDMEISGGLSANRIGEIIWNVVEIIKWRDGVYPILYSRKNLIDPWLAAWTAEQLNTLYYWLARYMSTGAEDPGPPPQPNRLRIERVIMHQTSDHKVDFPGEAASLSIDWDRWMIGDLAQMRNWIHNTWGGGEPQPTWEQAIDAWARGLGYDGPTP